MKKLLRLEPINIAGLKVNAYLLGGAIAFILIIGIALTLNLAPTTPTDSGLKGLNLEIFKSIGIGLKIESKEQAAQSIGSIAQDLEKAIGTVKSINKNLEGKTKKLAPAPSGLAGLSKGRTELPAMLAALLVVAVGLKLLRKQKSKTIGFRQF